MMTQLFVYIYIYIFLIIIGSSNQIIIDIEERKNIFQLKRVQCVFFYYKFCLYDDDDPQLDFMYLYRERERERGAFTSLNSHIFFLTRFSFSPLSSLSRSMCHDALFCICCFFYFFPSFFVIFFIQKI